MDLPKIKSPFQLIADSSGEISFEGAFELPNDGISRLQLVVKITMESLNDPSCDVHLSTRTIWEVGKPKDTYMGTFNCRLQNVSSLLYGFAKVQMVPTLVIS